MNSERGKIVAALSALLIPGMAIRGIVPYTIVRSPSRELHGRTLIPDSDEGQPGFRFRIPSGSQSGYPGFIVLSKEVQLT